MITANPLLGTFLHAIGALSSSACYAPQKKVNRWSWQTYWITQAAFCWFLLPILGAVLTIPNIIEVLSEAPRGAMLASYLLGMAYGIGGTAFNISIRYIGFSLTYAIAVGLSSVLGTLIPPLVRGTLVQSFSKEGSGWVMTGIVIGIVGIALCGVAGRLKEMYLQTKDEKTEFSMFKGLMLSLLAGVLSAVYGFALEAGEPIADVASAHGAGVWRGNIVYIFANTGAFVTTAIYCMFLHIKHKTLGELIELPAGPEKASLPLNFGMAALTGVLWYGQFFFYNLGHVRMGEYKFTSWAIHMIMLVLFSNAVAILFREWKDCRRSTKSTIGVALAVLVLAVLALTYGNYLGGQRA
ncbi:MAG: L-rhamnose/proton symporter RhaT [Kiritimatiellae bacterium]|nr:L-rhamnose/proton symporter RhaT [Kiritimatiellia bacterium]MDD5520513.1 L-rhamnose/proton symporter RhaT [Kiritimatiellia bacterium]